MSLFQGQGRSLPRGRILRRGIFFFREMTVLLEVPVVLVGQGFYGRRATYFESWLFQLFSNILHSMPICLLLFCEIMHVLFYF